MKSKLSFFFVLFALLLANLRADADATKQQIQSMNGSDNAATFEVRKPSRGEQQWVDSVMATLTLRQQVAQLMIARVPTKMDEASRTSFLKLIKRTRVGGVCFFAGYADDQMQLTKQLQGNAFVPLLVCIDAEWGLGMRLKDCFSFPRQSLYGTLPRQADTLVYDLGSAIARQGRAMGIHVNFAPVVDINSNPKNPVIGTRSFSNDPATVARLGIQYMRGMQDHGMMAVAKHFPGHGDTDKDSHKTLPVLNHTRQRLDSIELVPFRSLIDAGVMGVMTAHLFVPALDSTPQIPSSLSRPIVTDLLREELRFDGLVITDGIDMKAVSDAFPAGQSSVMAIRAGNDMVLLPTDLELAIDSVMSACVNDVTLRRQVEQSCRRVLTAKYRLGLNTMDLEDLHVPTVADSLECELILEGVRLNQDPRFDTILLRGMRKHAYPGCQMVVMHHGKVIFRRAYGSFVYDDDMACHVHPTTMYDLASVTKVAATTLALMKLVDNNIISLDDPLSRYLPYLRGDDKDSITFREALSHIARFKAYGAYWQSTSDPDTLLRLVAESDLEKQRRYLYSDQGFMLMADAVRRISGMSLDQFVNRFFYRPMGLKRTTFCPLKHGFMYDDIAPTEEDYDNRGGLIHGEVHDPNAYAMGGVAGHAGLFSTADEVAAIMQMLLNGGIYNGCRLLSSDVIDTFNTRYYAAENNRRALGFDKPLIHDKSQHVAPEASQSSFGHTGFTGTMFWADPQYDLVYVFLSNRVNPSATPNKLAQMDIRTDLQSLIYQDLKLK